MSKYISVKQRHALCGGGTYFRSQHLRDRSKAIRNKDQLKLQGLLEANLAYMTRKEK